MAGVAATSAVAMRRPVTVLPASAATGVTLARIRWMRCGTESVGKFMAAKATAPETCGVAIEVPSRY